MTDAEIFAALAAPFPPDRVSWRVGSVKKDGTAAMALAYIDARDVMERLDEVVGPAGWQRRHPHVNGTTTCEVDIWLPERGWVTKADGAGDTAVEAEKGSLSDSFKRAAVNWGVGRYLYDVKSPWVRIDQYKKILPEEEGKLRACLPVPKGRAAKVETPRQEPEATSGRKSAAQAKRDGDDEKIKADIAKCDRAGLLDWHTNFDNYTADLPLSWLDSVRDMLELRLEELNGAGKVAGAEADLDDGFRNAVGSPARSPGATSMAGRGGDRQGAAA